MTAASFDQAELTCQTVTLRSYTALMWLFWSQPTTRHYFGAASRFVLRLLAIPLFFLIIKRRRPSIVCVFQRRRLVGGFTLSQYGEIGNACLSNDRALRISAIRRLASGVGSIIASQPGRTIHARVLADNHGLRRALQRRGFKALRCLECIVTVPLGPFRWSWISKSRPRWLGSCFVRVSVLLRYELLPMTLGRN